MISETERVIQESELHKLILRKGGNTMGEYLVYDIETSLGLPHRVTVKADKNYRVDLCVLEPFGIEFEVL